MSAAEQSIADVLDRAADLIEPEGAWTQGTYARDKDGRALGDALDDGAVCFCALGAIEAVTKCHWSWKDADKILRSVLEDDDPNSYTPRIVGNWNDAPERAQSEVVAKLREAAALAREQGK